MELNELDPVSAYELNEFLTELYRDYLEELDCLDMYNEDQLNEFQEDLDY